MTKNRQFVVVLFLLTTSIRARSRPTDHYPEASGGSRNSYIVVRKLTNSRLKACEQAGTTSGDGGRRRGRKKRWWWWW